MLQKHNIRCFSPKIRIKLSTGFSSSAPISTHTQKDFTEEFHKNHIPLNVFQKCLLSVGSAAVSLMDPFRADAIACLGETTGYVSAQYIINKMQASPEGMEILKQRPRINSRTVDLEKLKTFPDGTLGKVYSNFLLDNKVTPDSRSMVQFVDDVNIAYAIQRYREVHDLLHATLQMPTTMLGEVSIKWVEAIQTTLPMCIGAAMFGSIRLKPKHRQLYRQYYLPWAIHVGKTSDFLLNIYFEKRWDQPLSEVHNEMHITPFVLPQSS